MVKVFIVWHNKEALKMECNKRNCNIHYAVFRESNLNQISTVLLNRLRWWTNYQAKSFFYVFGPIVLHFWQIFQNKMLHFFESGSTIFHFLLNKVFETYQVYCKILFIAFEFTFTVSLTGTLMKIWKFHYTFRFI